MMKKIFKLFFNLLITRESAKNCEVRIKNTKEIPQNILNVFNSSFRALNILHYAKKNISVFMHLNVHHTFIKNFILCT